jgi:hypothetical protein
LVLDIHRPADPYVRAVVTRGTADATIDGVIAIQYGARLLPTFQDSTVAGIETHVSPAEGAAKRCDYLIYRVSFIGRVETGGGRLIARLC